MDSNRVAWQSDSVRAAIESGDLGAILRSVRRANRLTLADLARRCGYSVSTLSRMERGKQPLRDVRVLRRMAEALRVSPSMFGLSDTPQHFVHAVLPAARVGVVLVPDEEAESMRRRTLLAGLTSLAGTAALGASSPSRATGSPAASPVGALERALLDPSAPSGIPVALPRLRQQVAAARLVFQHGRYSDVASRLPELLSTALATRAEAPSEHVAAACGLLTEFHTLTSECVGPATPGPRSAWSSTPPLLSNRTCTAARSTCLCTDPCCPPPPTPPQWTETAAPPAP